MIKKSTMIILNFFIIRRKIKKLNSWFWKKRIKYFITKKGNKFVERKINLPKRLKKLLRRDKSLTKKR
jgi:hypothetical protein